MRRVFKHSAKYLLNRKSGLTLDVPYGSKTDNVRIIQWTRLNPANQRRRATRDEKSWPDWWETGTGIWWQFQPGERTDLF